MGKSHSSIAIRDCRANDCHAVHAHAPAASANIVQACITARCDCAAGRRAQLSKSSAASSKLNRYAHTKNPPKPKNAITDAPAENAGRITDVRRDEATSMTPRAIEVANACELLP